MQGLDGRGSRWLGLAVAVVAFAVLAGAVELAGWSRSLVLPAWTGGMLALAAMPRGGRVADCWRRGR